MCFIFICLILTFPSFPSDPKRTTSNLPKVPSDRVYSRVRSGSSDEAPNPRPRESLDEEHQEALEKIVSFRGTPPAGRVRGDSAPAAPITTSNTNRVGPRRSIPFEPHLRRMEENMIRQLYFKVRIRTRDDGTIKLTIYGYLRGSQILKQRIDLIL